MIKTCDKIRVRDIFLVNILGETVGYRARCMNPIFTLSGITVYCSAFFTVANVTFLNEREKIPNI